ncbi:MULTISPECIES: LPS export ABC transporter permease LptF [unclassified Legionella]|uniref:LPS export ABC transporter permease LptF n=1 Tax=unclassified Legionella TaxID=2622702 RepID=UPI0010548D06|nr:LPS export ABC transporter permease LptF [Legionella sp. W10-070]MDI9818086.1 LPS export ABC transporter permease LptF [Legionella sp. PL877]
MLIFRYLAKEVFITLTSLTAILLLIFMSNQFVQYLNRAAAGNIPGMIIMKLMMLELPNLMGLLLPLGFYVALLIAYGRLYAESEMTVLQACGYGPSQLFKHSFALAAVVSIVVTVIILWVSPVIATERAKLMRTTGVQTLIQTIVPGRFRPVSGGRQVFYVESMNRNHTNAEHVFLARQVIKDNLPQWDILWAKQAFAETDPKTSEDYIVLQQGREYEGLPGRADYQVAQFDQYKVRLPHPTVAVQSDIRTAPTAGLLPFNNPDRRKAAELQWRLSVPIMVLVLTLVAVPLSRVNPRSGKYAKLLPAIVLYIVYANFMFVSRDWIIAGKVPLWVGVWWLHLSVAIIGLFLIWRNQGKLS